MDEAKDSEEPWFAVMYPTEPYDYQVIDDPDLDEILHERHHRSHFPNISQKFEERAGIFNSDKKHFSTSKWDPLKKRTPNDLKKNKKHCFEWATSTQHGVLARPVWKKAIKQKALASKGDWFDVQKVDDATHDATL